MKQISSVVAAIPQDVKRRGGADGDFIRYGEIPGNCYLDKRVTIVPKPGQFLVDTDGNEDPEEGQI